MKKKWVLIRIETKSREFLSKMIITYCLQKKGYGTIITSKMGTDMTSQPKGAYIINSLYRSQRRYVRNLKNYGHKVVLLDEEGLVYQNDWECVAWLDKPSLEMIDQLYCFGKEQCRVYNKYFPQYADKIFITGNPRMNLLNEQNVQLVSDEVSDIKGKYGSFILIVSLYTWANHNDTFTDLEERRNYIKFFMKSIEQEQRDDYDDHFDYDVKMFEAMKDLVLQIREKIDHKIVIRPHPSESMDSWIDFASTIDDVEVVREGPLLSWIIASDMIVQNNCTSAIESLFLHVPALSYRPYRDARYDQPLSNLVSVNLNTADEVIEMIKKLLNNPESYNFEEYEKAVADYVSFQNGIESGWKIADRIGELDLVPVNFSAIAVNYAISPRRIPYIIKEFSKKIAKYTPGCVTRHLPNGLRLKVLNVQQDITADKHGDISVFEVIKTLEYIDKIWGDGKTEFRVKSARGDIIITD